MESIGLYLAAHKTETILFTTHCRYNSHPIEIVLCTTLKYLRLWFDEKLTFRQHTRKTAEKINKKVANKQSKLYAQMKFELMNLINAMEEASRPSTPATAMASETWQPLQVQTCQKSVKSKLNLFKLTFCT